MGLYTSLGCLKYAARLPCSITWSVLSEPLPSNATALTHPEGPCTWEISGMYLHDPLWTSGIAHGNLPTHTTHLSLPSSGAFTLLEMTKPKGPNKLLMLFRLQCENGHVHIQQLCLDFCMWPVLTAVMVQSNNTDLNDLKANMHNQSDWKGQVCWWWGRLGDQTEVFTSPIYCKVHPSSHPGNLTQ